MATPESPKIQDLTLYPSSHQHIFFDEPLGRVPTDLRLIHKPTDSWFTKAVHHMISPFVARLHSSDRVAVPFESEIVPMLPSRVSIDLGDVRQPGQAALWAALEFYRTKSEMAPPSHLRAIDPDIVTGYTYQSFLHDTERPSWFTTNPRMMPSEMMPWGKDDCFTVISFQNDGLHPLPEVLYKLKDTCDNFYPDQNTSQAVGRIVGAQSVEAFEEAWNTSFAISDPLKATHELLNSGVFIASHKSDNA